MAAAHAGRAPCQLARLRIIIQLDAWLMKPSKVMRLGISLDGGCSCRTSSPEIRPRPRALQPHSGIVRTVPGIANRSGLCMDVDVVHPMLCMDVDVYSGGTSGCPTHLYLPVALRLEIL